MDGRTGGHVHTDGQSDGQDATLNATPEDSRIANLLHVTWKSI